MATPKKAGQKTTEKKSEPIEIGTFTDISKKNVAEQKSQEEPQNFPIVGIGASAGGLAAFEAFFNGIPADKDSDMAFVLVQHLAPDHKSMLTEIIQRYTRMQVFEVEDGMAVKPGCIYIIPPDHNMALLNGTLQLLERTSHNMPIDFFFRSLANDQHERAICIVLSGTGSDGTLGLRAVKGEGGIAIAQRPDTAEYDGMPASAIATGLVDYQLPPNEMAKQVISYVTHDYGISHKRAEQMLANNKNAFEKVCLLIRTHTGHDFSKYKPSTINRRIERRLAVHQIETMTDYVKYLQQTPTEIDVLFRALLIGVTSFFRDKDAFNKLEEEIIPKLFEGKPAGSPIRVWCAGCSTGEEAYSIAILLQEHLEKLKKSFNIKVFATDIDSHAITSARKGVYPGSITADLTSERLSRFFTLAPGNKDYRINKSIRDMIVFSEQNIIKDPHFSNLDLISCRNLFIYLSKELQEKLILLFHYALRSNGILFLGSSETVGDFELLFKVLDRELKLYQRLEDLQRTARARLTQILSLPRKIESVNNVEGIKTTTRGKQTLREITEQSILKESSVAGVLVNDSGDILYIHGRTGMYFEPSEGVTEINNILKMAREGLKLDLAVAFRNAAAKKETIRLRKINVKTNGHFSEVDLVVKPVVTELISTKERPLYIVLLEEVKTQEYIKEPETQDSDPLINFDARLEELKTELQRKEEYLKTANEELETSNEELKSSYEEMQSVNEELQSTNEELETTKEELQSINEELHTVNAELLVKVNELSMINNDMNNLLSGTNIATIFLDFQQNILRFTPTANKIINLVLSDVGRPVSHIASNFISYKQLTNDVKTVLDTLITKDIQIQTIDGKWYNMIIQPYRTIENVIEGVVLTFVDITEVKNAKDLLAISEMSYRSLFETAQEGILILDGITGKIKNVNPYVIRLLGYPEKQLLGKEVWDIGFLKDVVASKEKFLELQKQGYIRYRDLPLETADGKKIDVEFISNAYEIEEHKIIQCNVRDITQRKKLELENKN